MDPFHLILTTYIALNFDTICNQCPSLPTADSLNPSSRQKPRPSSSAKRCNTSTDIDDEENISDELLAKKILDLEDSTSDDGVTLVEKDRRKVKIKAKISSRKQISENSSAAKSRSQQIPNVKAKSSK